MSGVNQQERLSINEAKKWYLAGFIEGEGSLCVSIKNMPNSRFGYLVDPEFFLYQHKSGITQLHLAREIFGTGRIAPKSGNEDVLVYSIVNRRTIKERVIPFFTRFKFLSSKMKKNFMLFQQITELMNENGHLNADGLMKIIQIRESLNEGRGRKRKYSINHHKDFLSENPQRLNAKSSPTFRKSGAGMI